MPSKGEDIQRCSVVYAAIGRSRIAGLVAGMAGGEPIDPSARTSDREQTLRICF